MSALLTCSGLGKSFTSYPLFEGISLSIEEGERIGMLGPNGAGKSTLLKIFAGLESADEGTISRQRSLRLAYLAQDEHFLSNMTVHSVLESALSEEKLSEDEIAARIGEVRSILGFADIDQPTSKLSGGWRKRLAIGAQLIRRPEILLLDEPTNHLDLEGIAWLEKFMKGSEYTFVIISHDRTLLERVTTRIVEINRIYPQGFFSVAGNYSRFLEKRAEYLEGIARYEDGLRNKVRREIEWLRRGPKARATKAKGRIQEAGRLIAELKDYEARSASRGKADIDFLSSGRKTKKLISVEGISKRFGDQVLFEGLEFTLSPGVRLGIVGANGSGKSTLLKMLEGKVLPDTGTITPAPKLRLVSFQQDRSGLDQSLSLKRAISADGDTVVFQDRALHVAAWAKRFLFRAEQLEMPVRSLSGGEQARLLIAKLMLQPADVLLLDEPTNDLDIDTLQVLEESLEEFPGAIVLVSHDRFMLDRVSTVLLGLDGTGRVGFFADYAQWEEYWKESQQEQKAAEVPPVKTNGSTPIFSQEDRRELNRIEKQIQQLEMSTKLLKEELISPKLASNVPMLEQLYRDLQAKEKELEQLFNRWSELESLRLSRQ